jgi:methionine-rich copper-binding protein CopC
MLSRLFALVATLALAAAASAGTAFAHAYPQTMDPAPNARLDATPAHIGIVYDSPVAPSGSSMSLLDSTGSPIQTTPDEVQGNNRTSVSPTADLLPGPYTVAWTSLSADDGHQAQGFYTFVVNGGPVGILEGEAQSQTQAADLMATLTVMPAPDGSSLLRVDLNNTAGVERVRIRLSRPDLGEDLLDTTPSGDGGWVLNNNEVAVPGAWHAAVRLGIRSAAVLRRAATRSRSVLQLDSGRQFDGLEYARHPVGYVDRGARLDPVHGQRSGWQQRCEWAGADQPRGASHGHRPAARRRTRPVFRRVAQRLGR